jgi:hypothetical protein
VPTPRWGNRAPERAFDRQWALAVLRRALDRLRTECGRAGVKAAVHRLRLRYGEALREEVATTVADPADVDTEIRHLLAAIEG